MNELVLRSVDYEGRECSPARGYQSSCMPENGNEKNTYTQTPKGTAEIHWIT